jgi:hypothetical protein
MQALHALHHMLLHAQELAQHVGEAVEDNGAAPLQCMAEIETPCCVPERSSTRNYEQLDLFILQCAMWAPPQLADRGEA